MVGTTALDGGDAHGGCCKGVGIQEGSQAVEAVTDLACDARAVLWRFLFFKQDGEDVAAHVGDHGSRLMFIVGSGFGMIAADTDQTQTMGYRVGDGNK